MKIRRPVRIETAERSRDEIAALRPTPDEDAAWALDKRRHAWIAFAKFGLVPGVALSGGMILTGLHGHWWWIPVALLFGGITGTLAWVVQWRVAEEPRARLAALRASRLYEALARERDDESSR